MITPRFSLSQDEIFLIINIRAPYCNLKELEIYVENADFRFVCTPYYLRLNLPGKILDNDASSGEFNNDLGEFVLKYAKVTKGECFPGLEFITSLLNPPKKLKKFATTDIEVLTSESINNHSSPEKETMDPEIDNNSIDNDKEGNEWHIEQNIPDIPNIKIKNDCKYGFANQKFEILRNIEDEFYSVFDIRNADKMSINERKLLRVDNESMCFSADHFVADFFDDSQIKDIVKQENALQQKNTQHIAFTDKEKDILKDLPNKEYLLNKEEINSVLFSLIDILFAYCYDKRTTDFESNCESGWTITKLSSTLSWFDVFNNENELLNSCFRRSLIYPLFRNFELSKQVFKDLTSLLNLGPVCIVKSLVDIYNIFNSSADPRYILNDLYIKDYIIFIQKCPKNNLDEIINKVKNCKIDESDVNLNLKKIIHDQLKETNAGNSILEKMAKLNISRIESDSESEDSESDSSATETSSEDTSDSDSEASGSETSENKVKTFKLM